MDFKKFSDSKIKKLNCADIQLIKLSVFGFALFIAKLWEPLLSLAWYWYFIIFVLAGIRPMIKIFKK